MKLARLLKGRLSQIGESLNIVGGNHIEDARIAIICAAHAKTVEAMLGNILTAQDIATCKPLS
jgi:hypothetical protein